MLSFTLTESFPTMKYVRTALSAAAITLAACDGFREAMTAHVDVVARAGSQELSVDRFAELLGKSQVPVTPEVARMLADLWVNYQLLAQAAASGDSLKDSTRIDAAMWPIIAQARASKLHDMVLKTDAAPDSAASPARYAQGEQLAASHILISVPQGATPAAKDSARQKAQALRTKVTPGNFAELAKQNSQDPGSAPRGGSLGVFPRGTMVPEFEQALLALKPGEVSPAVESPFGYHIIRRATYDEVKDEFAQAVGRESTRAAERAYLEKLEKGSNLQFKDNAAATIRAVGKDLEAHRTDKTVIATSRGGDFTAARFAQWIDVHPQETQLRSGIQNAPDSAVLQLARNIFRNELVLRQADSAKIALEPKELSEIRGSFVQFIGTTWGNLGVSPQNLADSAKSEDERQRVAAARINTYLRQLLTNQAQFVDIPQPVEAVLRETYDWKVSQAGIERAVERAASIRAKTDSARAKDRPRTQVPLTPRSPGAGEARKAPPAGGARNAPSTQPADTAPTKKQP